jgi:hypothetical protein
MPAQAASVKQRQRRVRDRMLGLGMSRAGIAREMGQQFGLRPRAAWRIAYGWTLDDAADQFNALPVAGDVTAGRALTGARLSEWECWPVGGRKPSVGSLLLLAAVYQAPVLDLLDLDDREALPAADLAALAAAGVPPVPDAGPQVAAGPAGGILAAMTGRPAVLLPSGHWADVAEVVMAAAGESAEQAAADAGRVVPLAAVEHVRDEVQRLAREYATMPPLDFLAVTRLLRDQARQLAARTGRPGQLSDLHLVTGAACALMADASFDLAVWPAALEQAQAARTHGEIAGHHGLQAWAAGFLALLTYWRGQPRDAVTLLSQGLEIAPPGIARARLHCIAARAQAYLGDVRLVRAELAAADAQRDAARDSAADELHEEIGGEFGWDRARAAMCSASALLQAGDADGAARRAEEAIRLHALDGTGSVIEMTARADLAHAELARGRLDAAEAALGPVWELTPGYRRHGLVSRLEGVAGTLTARSWASSGIARDLRGQIEVFTAGSVPRTLAALPGPGGE